MIQRRSVGLDPPSQQHNPAIGKSRSRKVSSGIGKRNEGNRLRKSRPKRMSGLWKAMVRKMDWRQNSKEDLVVNLLQILSVSVILGCPLVLLIDFLLWRPKVVVLIADDDDGVASESSRQLSWMDRLRVRFGNFERHHPLHRDHENGLLDWRAVDSRHNRQTKKKPHQHPMKVNLNGDDGFKILPPSSIYTIPEAMPHIGDKSDEYATLRKEYDAMDLPFAEQRYQFQTMLMEEGPNNKHDKNDDDNDDDENDDDNDNDNRGDEKEAYPFYDIHNCPQYPPEGYPHAWNLLQILDHWPPDQTEIPADNRIFQGLCVFDYQTEYRKALNYRNREVPFIVSNDPAVQKTARRWMAPGYLDRLMGEVKHRTEYSETNHFMYWNAGRNFRKKYLKHLKMGNWFQGNRNKHSDGRGVDADLEHWQQPTTMMRMGYREWLSHANGTNVWRTSPHDPHYYYRLIGCGEEGPLGTCDKGSSEYLFDELPFFQPRENLYMVEPEQQKGIHCRFGMKGVIAENHFDQSRNAIALMGGERRYILSHPNQCQLLSLLPMGHPSARHSAVDWTDPDLEKFPEFAQAEANEVVLQAGDVLYLPTNWFHFIVSLGLNYQCNTRSGVTPNYFPEMRECGF